MHPLGGGVGQQSDTVTTAIDGDERKSSTMLPQGNFAYSVRKWQITIGVTENKWSELPFTNRCNHGNYA